MGLLRHADPLAFLAAASRVLERDEAEGLMLEARVRGLIEQPPPADARVYLATFSQWRSHGAALQTREYPVSIGPSDAAAAAAFADDLACDHLELSGVVGSREACEAFVQRWAMRTGRAHRLRFRLRHYVLTRVAKVREPPGRARIAAAADVAWLLESQLGFIDETGVPETFVDQRARIERAVARRAYWIWDDSGPVCYAGWHPATPTAARISPVYTRPERRVRGYATALVASLSRALLENGQEKLSLTTDLANPTSNAIYARIGYRPVSDAWHFDLMDKR